MGLEPVDVVVVGAGLAGLSAAIRAAQMNLSVIVLEQGADEGYLCNSRYTSGLFHVALQDMAGDEHEILTNILKQTEGEADPLLAKVIAGNARRALDWLRSLGVRFIRVGHEGARRNSLAPPYAIRLGLNWRGRAGDVMLKQLAVELRRLGGTLAFGSTARALLTQGDQCIGIGAAERAGDVRYSARAVVLADGGYQSNIALLQRFITPRPESVLQRNARSGSGAALIMAQSIGARLARNRRPPGSAGEAVAV